MALKLKKTFLLYLVFLMVSSGVTAQAESYGKDEILADVASPLTPPAVWVVLGGAAATGLVLWTNADEPAQREATKNKYRLTWLGDIGGAAAPNLIYTLGMGTAYFFNSKKSYFDLSMLMLKASSYSTIVTWLLKVTTNEPRPDGSDLRSFPSGHTSISFAFASVVGEMHEWYWGAAAYTFATLNGYSRMNDNKHWLRDVIAGATIGASYGIGLSHRLRNANSSGSKSTSAEVVLLPTDDLLGAVAFTRIQF